MLRTLFAPLKLSAAALLLCVTMVGCSDSGDGAPPTTPPAVTRSVQTNLAAGMRALDPEIEADLADRVDVSHLGVTDFDRTYRVTTPADTDFSFAVVASRAGNFGETKVSIAHGADGTLSPDGGAETLAQAGIRVDGPGVSNEEPDWIDARGDGFTRVTISGRIDDDQVLVVRIPQPEGGYETIGVEVVVGPPSDINIEPVEIVDTPEIKQEETIYSSDSWHFGLPAIAVNGDRVTVVAYDGNASDPYAWERNRRWLQWDKDTSVVTGGGAASASQDMGFWRDQEIVGLGNVIAIVYTGNGEVRTDISLDRGATFPIQQVLEPAGLGWGQRLVQVGISQNYKLGFLFWRSVATSTTNVRSELVLIEGTPGPLDATNTPSSYTFGAPIVVHNPGRDVTPLVMELAYSAAGDLVMGYGYTVFTPSLIEQWTGTLTASFRCATRLVGQTVFTDVLVDSEENIVPMDPSVSLIGDGPDMQVFYAYEKSDGVYLKHSTNAGLSFTNVVTTGRPGANMPSVHAREQDGKLRVDLLFLDPAADGLELHDLRWEDFATAPSTTTLVRLIEATREDTPGGSGSGGAPGGGGAGGIWAPDFPSSITTSVAPFGFDAALDGDDVAVVVHVRKQENWFFVGLPFDRGVTLPPFFAGEGMLAGGAAAAPPPPVLLPGLMGSVPTPSPDHSSTLKVFLID